MPDFPYGHDYTDENQTPVLADVLLTRSALRDLPDPAPLIEGVLDKGTIALLYGKWGTGKSFIALDQALSVATGRPWQGRPTQPGKVLYVAAEGAFGLKGRTQAWEQGWHTGIGDDTFHVLPKPVNLSRSVDVNNLQALIEWNGYGLVVIDTLARCMVGADENSARDCGEVVDVLHRLRERTPDGRGVVSAVHHTGKDGKTFRGSSVFEAGADTVYSVSRDGAVIMLDREKRKDGPIVDSHQLKLTPVDGTNSVIVECSTGFGTYGRADELMSHFKSHFAGTGATGPQLRDTTDMPKTTFHRALSDLVQRGDLINEGTARRTFYTAATK